MEKYQRDVRSMETNTENVDLMNFVKEDKDEGKMGKQAVGKENLRYQETGVQIDIVAASLSTSKLA